MCLATASWHAAAQDCVLDVAQFDRQAETLAARHRGATWDAQSGFVRWDSKIFGAVAVRIGGCEHFGLTVSAHKPSARRLAQAQVLALAKRLIVATWPQPYADDGLKILSGKGQVVRQDAGTTMYDFESPGYVGFFVEHSFGPTGETITVTAIDAV